MLKLKLQYSGRLIWRADSQEKILMLGKIESKSREWQRMRRLDSIISSVAENVGKLREMVRDREPWPAAPIELQSQTWVSNWTTTPPLKEFPNGMWFLSTSIFLPRWYRLNLMISSYCPRIMSEPKWLVQTHTINEPVGEKILAQTVVRSTVRCSCLSVGQALPCLPWHQPPHPLSSSWDDLPDD